MARLITSLMLFFTSAAMAKPCTGTVYEKDSNRGKVLFDFKQVETAQGAEKKLHNEFIAPDKKLAYSEDAVVTEGTKAKTYFVHHKDTDEEGSLEVKGDKVLFSYTKEGKTKTSDEDLTDNLVITPILVDYLMARRDLLLAGKDIPVRLAVLDRRETVGFTFSKTSEGTTDGKPTFTVRMKPTSFIIATIVDPIYFTFTKDGMHLVEIIGRTQPKRLVDGKWKDLDADIWYRCE